MPSVVTFEELAEIVGRSDAGRRQLIAIAGAPGSGKSTTAEQLVSRLNAQSGDAALIPMDGYHFDDRVLIERNARARKGAPDTFDVLGLFHMLARLRANAEDEIAIPVFDRDLEISRAGARLVSRAARILVVEGNYLLLNTGDWPRLHPMFDVKVMVDVGEDVLRQRLTDRWRGYRLSPAEIEAKVESNDLPNGRFVIGDSVPADYVLKT